jgi:hypothetical protein
MPRVLYRGGTEGPRAGVDGPRRPLQDQSLKALCKAGFSQAVYAYRTGWNGTENVSCAGNSVQYEYHRWDNRAALKQVFAKLHEIITQDKGATYVHCWYGMHASGFISATALAQFCDTVGWDSRRAAEYWDSVIPPKIRYPKEHDQVANFVQFTDPELQISVKTRREFARGTIERGLKELRRRSLSFCPLLAAGIFAKVENRDAPKIS